MPQIFHNCNCLCIIVGYLLCPPVDAVVSVVVSNKKTWGDRGGHHLLLLQVYDTAEWSALVSCPDPTGEDRVW